MRDVSEVELQEKCVALAFLLSGLEVFGGFDRYQDVMLPAEFPTGECKGSRSGTTILRSSGSLWPKKLAESFDIRYIPDIRSNVYEFTRQMTLACR